MVYCKKCKTKLSINDKFCKTCGTKIKPIVSKTKKEVVYPIPALLSFLFPGLGQIVKGQIFWAILIWFGFILGNTSFALWERYIGPQTLILMVLFNIILWIYQINDAYNSPKEG